MVLLSKVQFDQVATSDITCQIFHPWAENCSKAHVVAFLDCFLSTSKFLFPFWLFKVLYKYKKLDKKAIERQVNLYVRSVLFFTLFGTTILAANCFLRRITGRFFYYLVGLGCGTLAGLNIFIETKEYRIGKCLLFTNLVLEDCIKLLEQRRIIKRTSIKETIVFSTLTALLMYLFARTEGAHTLSMLWFFVPDPIKEQPHQACSHKKSCTHYALDGFVKYFGFGYAMEFLKNFLRHQKQIAKNPKTLLSVLSIQSNFRFALVLGGFVCAYKSLSCYFVRKERQFKPEHSLIAGFVAGLVYYLKPDLSFTVMAFTTIVQLLLYNGWNKWEKKGQIQRVPFVELWTALSAGVLIHHRFFHPDICVNYITKSLDFLSNNRMTEIHDHLMSFARSKLVL